MKKSGKVDQKIGILFGTVHKERENPAKIARTSLSSTTGTVKMCEVIKVSV